MVTFDHVVNLKQRSRSQQNSPEIVADLSAGSRKIWSQDSVFDQSLAVTVSYLLCRLARYVAISIGCRSQSIQEKLNIPLGEAFQTIELTFGKTHCRSPQDSAWRADLADSKDVFHKGW
jgi:hypothetical protein